MTRPNASSPRNRSRQRRRQFENRGVLSDRTLRMGNMVREQRTKVHRSPGGATVTRQEIWDIPTTEALENLRRKENRTKATLADERQRIAVFEHELRSTPKFRLVKRLSLKGIIENEKGFHQHTREVESDAKAYRKKIEELLKKAHHAKLKAMRGSRAPKLP